MFTGRRSGKVLIEIVCAPFPLAGPCSPGPLAQLQSRQREYKLAALHAKQQGDTAAAAKHFRKKPKWGLVCTSHPTCQWLLIGKGCLECHLENYEVTAKINR